MFCEWCGNIIGASDKVCSKCGKSVSGKSATNQGEPKTPDGGKSSKGHKRGGGASGNGPKKPGKGCLHYLFRFVVVLFLLLIVYVFGFVGLYSLGIIQDEEPVDDAVVLTGEVLDDTDYEVEKTDADEYFKDIAEIIAVLDVAECELVSEKDVEEEFLLRGFDQNSITYNYSVDGDYEDDTEVNGSEETHPVYESYYETESEVWYLYMINDAVMAYPIIYNNYSERGVIILVSENETLTSYDSVTNRFYVTIPDGSEVIVYTVDHIDATTLKGIATEVFDEL